MRQLEVSAQRCARDRTISMARRLPSPVAAVPSYLIQACITVGPPVIGRQLVPPG